MDSSTRPLPPLATLRPFEAAARLESFTRAAAELHLTQAAISRQIRLLEEDLGVTLFERRHRRVFLTREGREFGRTVSQALESIASDAQALRGEGRDMQVVLFCQLCEAFYWLMPRLDDFNRRHPEFDIKLATSTRPITEFGEPFDVALQTSGRPNGTHPLALTAADEIFPVCSPAYLEGQAEPLSLDDLPDHRLLHYRVEPAEWLEWPDWLRAVGRGDLVLGEGVDFDSYPLLLQAAIAGQGIALGWRRTTQHLIDRDELVRPVVESLPQRDAIAIYTRRGASRRAAPRALLAWLDERLRDDMAPT
ncbi:LysR family transcriptional regulator [Halomonas eurihalina]|uniref:LysR family transcriptional regulator n=1 Tax=Halomonas eurihalina TaxID=42566 RepID=A0A5D9CXF5_HALER|nr:LysR substrate-binding domain-containing protein [Halomonas eurihalina]MDR5860877.1 LysR substrate-binding domain-containing protein [Halomonas eurihalina]TZG35863.1 LysR family transcriptional regulator [Halomonas eurihalina]